MSKSKDATTPEPRKSLAERALALYPKDNKMRKILDESVVTAKVYTLKDGVIIPDGHPVKEMTGLVVVPFNKIVQFAGEPDTGKSTAAAELMAEAQRQGFKVILWDAEDKFDAYRFDTEFGGNSSELEIIKTNEIRKGGQLVKDYIKLLKQDDKDVKIFVVWDSVGGSISRSETERNLADEKHGQPGQDAKENGSVARHWVGQFNLYPDSIAIVLVNQTYAKIGFMQKGKKAKGGSGIEFHSSAVFFFNRIKTLTKTVDKVKMKYGIITRVMASKNHLTQGKLSVYQKDFQITAEGIKPLTASEVTESDEDSDDSEQDES